MTYLWVLSSANLPYNFIVILRTPLHLQLIYDCNSESDSPWKSWVVQTIFVPWRTKLSIHISVNSSHWLCQSPTHRREVPRFIQKNWNRDHYPADRQWPGESKARRTACRGVFSISILFSQWLSVTWSPNDGLLKGEQAPNKSINGFNSFVVGSRASRSESSSASR